MNEIGSHIDHITRTLKRKLDALRAQGYTASGYVRAVLEKELNQAQVKGQKGR